MAAYLSRLRSAIAVSGGGWARSYARTAKGDLFTRLCSLGDPSINLAAELDEWVSDGTAASPAVLRRTVIVLRKHRRYKQALEVSEWMAEKGNGKFSSVDHARQLDLVGRVQGVKSAEEYFNNLKEEHKREKTYGSLLNCYVRKMDIDKALSHLQRMKELGFASFALAYNDIMCMYARLKKYEKVPEVLEEMKRSLVVPNNFSYRISINSYGARSDIQGMERILAEMESQNHIVMDWNTYAVVANIYIKANLPEKAISALKKTEEKLAGIRNWEGYRQLISLNASIGNKCEVMRIWELFQRLCGKVANKEFIVMLGALVKLNELEVAESLLNEWKHSAANFDFRVPNVLLIRYCQEGMIEKAEALFQDMMKDGKAPIPNTFATLAGAYEVKGEMKKAVELMISAFSCFPGNEGWLPQPQLVSSLLNWLSDEGELAEVISFVGMLRSIIPMNKEMYMALIKVNMRSGKEVTEILKSMKADNIELDEDFQKILSISQ